MNEAANKAKQTIVDKIKSSTNILVTVSTNPTVDDLSAALGLTALLNKLGKHATAIFSGAIPPAITFLEPDKVFENTADSLRDFIIALDKEKADHLRYKVEGDVVKIFITPYRTTINSDDLEFTQGDFNVELVLALGVNDQAHLDIALSAHGQMMSDVSIMTLSAADKSSQLGSVDWRDEGASCLSEMVGVLATEFQTDKSLLDQQISTALLTGIVSATERFSNPLTSSRVMAMAAQLMAAGADQQLIAAKLQESHAIDALPIKSVEKNVEEKSANESAASDSLVISHEGDVAPEAIEEIEESLPTPVKVDKPAPESEPEVVPELELPELQAVPSLPLPPELPDLTLPIQDVQQQQIVAQPEITEEPMLGGTLNATSDQAAEDARKQLDDQQNKTILSHSYLGQDSAEVAPINSVAQDEDTKDIDIFSELPNSTGTTSTPIDLNVPQSTVPPVSDLPLPPPPPVPDFSDIAPASTLPDEGTPDAQLPPDETPSTMSTLPDSNDPSQFKIPNQ